MNASISEQSIKALFAAEEQSLTSEDFTLGVLAEVEQIRKRLLTKRILIGVVVFLLSIPLEDFVLALSQIMLVSIYEMPDGLASQILAPVNSVGGLLSAILLFMRLVQKKILKR